MSNAKVKVNVPRLNMKSLRREMKLSQHDLAVIVGCTANHIRYLEQGTVSPSSHLANTIANALGESVYVVFPDIFQKR